MRRKKAVAEGRKRTWRDSTIRAIARVKEHSVSRLMPEALNPPPAWASRRSQLGLTRADRGSTGIRENSIAPLGIRAQFSNSQITHALSIFPPTRQYTDSDIKQGLRVDAAEMAWREDNRRRSNGEQYLIAVNAVLAHPISRAMGGLLAALNYLFGFFLCFFNSGRGGTRHENNGTV